MFDRNIRSVEDIAILNTEEVDHAGIHAKDDLGENDDLDEAVAHGEGPREHLVPERSAAKDAIAPDKWNEQLLKYFPAESLSLYVALEGIIRSAVPDTEVTSLRAYLAGALIFAVAFTWLYLQRVWKISKTSQILISCGALIVYVFAIGGVFATFGFYRHFMGALALIVITAFLAFVPPPGPPRT